MWRLKDQQRLVGPVPLHPEVHHLVPQPGILLELPRKALLVQHAVAEGIGIPHEDDGGGGWVEAVSRLPHPCADVVEVHRDRPAVGAEALGDAPVRDVGPSQLRVELRQGVLGRGPSQPEGVVQDAQRHLGDYQGEENGDQGAAQGEEELPAGRQVPAAGRRTRVHRERSPTVAITFSSTAMGVGRALISRVVRVGWFEAKYSAYRQLSGRQGAGTGGRFRQLLDHWVPAQLHPV